MPSLTVVLNGTDDNPWSAMGLTHNPFPQLGRAEWDAATLRLQSLGGAPIPDTGYIRDRLAGFSAEFIELCCARYVKGALVKFDVQWEDSE